MIAAGLLPLASPAWAQAGGQRANSTVITPKVGYMYDSNVFQVSKERFDSDLSDTIVSPGIAASVKRTIGRNSLAVAVDAAYEVHRRYTTLNQVNISGSGAGTLALTGYCLASPTARVTVQQNNLSGAGAVKNSQTVQNYTGTVSCKRPFGLFPSATVTYQSVTNSQSRQSWLDQRTLGVSGGVGYAVPTIGSLLFSVGEQRIRQPDRDRLDGAEDGSDVFSAGLTFDRAVAPRLSFSLGVRYLSVSPLRATTPGFAGPGYRVSVDYHPSPRLSLVATATREVSGSGDVASSYVLANSYGLTGVLNLATRTTLDLSLQHFDRDYRGESLLFFPIPRGRERGEAVSGSLGRLLGNHLQLRAFASYTTLDAQSDYYDFTRLQLGASAGARF